MVDQSSRSRSTRWSLAALFAAVVVVASTVFAAQPALAADSDVVSMTADLASCVDANLQVPAGTPVTKGALATLNSLTCDPFHTNAVDSLRGLQYATNLGYIYLTGESSSDGDLSPISGLTNLTSALIFSFNITDIAPLAKLTSLTSLYLDSNPLTDVREVSNLVNLRQLSLISGFITTPPDVSKLTALYQLDLSGNDLTTAPNVSNMPSLQTLVLNHNQLTALPAFSGSPELSEIDVSFNEITSLTPVQNAPGLNYLSLDHNRISTIAPLASDSALVGVGIDHNAIIDLSPLALLANLQIVNAESQSASLPDAFTTVPYALPTMKDPRGNQIAVSVSADSTATGSVSGSTVTWSGVGSGLLTFDQTVVFGNANVSTTFSGTITQNAKLGTLTKATPTISGTATVGQKLTANPGSWGPSPVLLKYQWYRNGTAISGATSSSHTLASSDGGTKITVTVTGSKPGYAPVSVTSAATATVAKLLTATPTPTISGTTTVGQTLTASAGSWSPSPVTLGYQWYRNGTAIGGATAATRVLTSLDAGATLTVAVTGTRSGYASVTKTSAATTTVAKGTLTTATPTISGTAKVGSTLTAKPGSWAPSSVTFTYKWYRAGIAISGATGATYTLTSSDAAKAITVKVTGSAPGYTTASKTSAAVTPKA